MQPKMQKTPKSNPFEEIDNILSLSKKELRKKFREIIEENCKIQKREIIGIKKLKIQLSKSISQSVSVQENQITQEDRSNFRKNLNATFEEIWEEIRNKKLLDQIYKEATDTLSPNKTGEETLDQMYKEEIDTLSPDELKILGNLPK
ncbi:hypothetical protein K9N08_00585 [Candidatus Gracilibacteria bacterium]|nr:hypothetical protein [Candidatus Gracilibacteria bacterium]MCF7856039.1 hypothetical protein [Candidatus Gracilibacteria bacterium]MCF7896406.1 hypothetical protein [Candidatus Gracilibacteria bacterium]